MVKESKSSRVERSKRTEPGADGGASLRTEGALRLRSTSLEGKLGAWFWGLGAGGQKSESRFRRAEGIACG
jgi:hypothetical protein